ncbi:hypothetical protein ACWTU5_32760, partial [Mesorhizobium sp. 98Argb]
MDPRNSNSFRVTALWQVQDAGSGGGQAGQVGQLGFEQHVAEARRADPLQRVRDAEPVSSGGSQEPGRRAAPSPRSDGVPEALRPLFDDRADEPPTDPEELLRLEQGFREVLQRRQDDQAASAIKDVINVSFAVPRGFSHGAQRVPDAMLSSLDRDGHLPDAGQARQVKQHVAEARRADPAPVASGAHNAPYPHLSGEHRDLVDQAITHVAARKHYSKETVRNYRNALRQLANDLGARGQADDLKSHQSLVGHLDAFFPKSRKMKSVLNVLRAYDESPGYSAIYPHLSGEHRVLIDQAITQVGPRKHYSEGTVRIYRNALCRLANDLGARGQAGDLENHQSLVDHVDAFFPKDNTMKKALNVLRAYHERGYSATAGRPAPSDAHVLEQVASDSRLASSTRVRYGHSPRKLRAPEPASPATARLSDTYRGVPLVDLTTSSDAQMRAFPSGSSNLPEGAVLGADELLSDAHIHRDYRLLEQDLQAAHPALAARTRLVDAIVSHHLRRHDVDVQGSLLSIYHQNGAPADFVFLPVNSADPMDPAPDPQRIDHWSLLLVDRRDPKRAVAYHYDSIQQNGQGYNHALARELAARLDATTLVTPAMARQNNAVDCGVFVVDGTRELVRRLANEERPDPQLPLHLNYLAADRQALQNRLREQRLPHEPVAIPAEAFLPAGSQVQHAVLQEQQARQIAPAP